MRIKTKAVKAAVLYTLTLICAQKYAKEHYVDLKTAAKRIPEESEYKIVTSKNWLKLLPKGIDAKQITYVIRELKCYKKLSHKWTREIDCKCVFNTFYRELGMTVHEVMTLREIEKIFGYLRQSEEEQ